jgi:hypothetical protein
VALKQSEPTVRVGLDSKQPCECGTAYKAESLQEITDVWLRDRSSGFLQVIEQKIFLCIKFQY